MKTTRLHPIHPSPTEQAAKGALTPFANTPHPLCLKAAEAVKAYLATRPDWQEEIAQGKMFGVLVCQDTDGTLGFLAAYSGQIQGREDHEWFVPAVYDYLQPDGYFKQEEAAITAINQRISALENAGDYVSAKEEATRLQAEAEAAISAYKTMMREAKARRDELRTAENSEALIRESQFQKAELRRLKQAWQIKLDAAKEQVITQEQQIGALKQERKRRSDALQRWLFDQFRMRNERGEERTLTDIFAQTPQQLPPSGSGECCAPKLLQYAFAHQLRPLYIAEFWQGRSPRMEIRHHDHYYPACRGKCRPILTWMLSLTAADTIGAHPLQAVSPLEIIYADDDLLVVNKPAGLLSVPGKTAAPSVATILEKDYGKVLMVHRLDMDTSGLLVVARNEETYHALQRQFLNRQVQKRYIAVVDGVITGKGTIQLPLRPDVLDRPRQLVDPEHGKEAITDYEALAVEGGHTRIALTPHTGRTHQLRVHCAHPQGLNAPIVGDVLYGQADGHPKGRLLLHAETLSFYHIKKEQQLSFTAAAPF